MLGRMSLAVGVLVSTFAPQVFAVDVTRDPAKDEQLFTEPTRLDANKALNNSDWLFDFNIQPYYTFTPGGVTNANRATFPATVGQGMTMAMLNLGPCSMLPPHFHPRASNYVVSIHGQTNTYMIQENGASMVQQTLNPGQMTIFPQGSVHMMYNTGCENAQLVSALSSEDSGTSNLGAMLFANGLPIDEVAAALGNQGIPTNSTAGNLPPVGTGANYGTQACLARCKAYKRNMEGARKA
ncbi:hypothetical protein M8818_004624 [Zalaria obscura]|uniref:Uncharacterized protein n=1 Tax=Zalaria obscura TaxID=2024903 RepID=A0ACC3SBN4_9PEZI